MCFNDLLLNFLLAIILIFYFTISFGKVAFFALFRIFQLY